MDCCCDINCTACADSTTCKPGILNTVAADTIGLLWRAASGTVDPWTKKELQAGEVCTLLRAGATSCYANNTACSDVTETLKTTPGGSSDPSSFVCGVKNSVSKSLCITNNLGKTILFVGIGALLLLIAFNFAMRE